jgi:thiol:disulfide interchange protein DsbD
MIQDPTSWNFSVKKHDATHYTLTANTTIKPKWHIYGIQPGGEGELIGTSFQFDGGGAKADGKVKEETPAVATTLLDERVNLHSDNATFKVNVVGKKGQMISGTVEYQACNDMMCLPPKKQKFSVKLP